MAFTDGALPQDTTGNAAEGLYVPGVGTVAAQGGTVATDSSGQPYAPRVVTFSNAAFSLLDGTKATYIASKTGLAAATSSATDIFTVTGSASKTVRITRLGISATVATAAATIDIVLLVRSTANSGGTSTGSPTLVPYDSNSSAATATVLSYTANPTTGNLVGNVGAFKLFMNVAATGTSDKVVLDFGNRPAQAIVLRGTSQVFAVNLNSQTTTNATSFDIFVEWTEE